VATQEPIFTIDRKGQNTQDKHASGKLLQHYLNYLDPNSQALGPHNAIAS